MGLSFVIFLIVMTSTLAYVITSRIRPMTGRMLLAAVGALLDWAGLFALFMVTNLALGMLLILVIRGFTPRFVSMYELQNLFLLILSAAQAFVFLQCCKRT